MYFFSTVKPIFLIKRVYLLLFSQMLRPHVFSSDGLAKLPLLLCSSVCVFAQLQQQQSRLMKINHDLRHKISVVEAQGKALIEQKVELEASAQARGQEVSALRQEVARFRDRLQGDPPTQNPEEPPPQPPSPAEVTT